MSNRVLKEKPRRLWAIIKWKLGSSLRVTQSRAQGDLLYYRFSWEETVQYGPHLRARRRESQLCSPAARYCHRPGRNEDPLNRQITPLFDTLFDGLFKQWATKERNFPRNLIPGKESQQGTCLSEGGKAAAPTTCPFTMQPESAAPADMLAQWWARPHFDQPLTCAHPRLAT